MTTYDEIGVYAKLRAANSQPSCCHMESHFLPNTIEVKLIVTLDLPPVKPSAIALGTIFNHGIELAGMLQTMHHLVPTPN